MNIIVAIDGKCCYSRGDKGKRENVLYMVSAWQQENAAILGQVGVEKKSNEITAIRKSELPGKPNLSAALKMWSCALDADTLNYGLFHAHAFS